MKKRLLIAFLALSIFNNSSAFSLSSCWSGIKNTAIASASLVSLVAKKTASVAVSATKVAGKVLTPVVKPIANHPYISFGVFVTAGVISTAWCLKKIFLDTDPEKNESRVSRRRIIS